jgi:hypothetical protein
MKYSQKSEFREVNVGRRSVEKVMSWEIILKDK